MINGFFFFLIVIFYTQKIGFFPFLNVNSTNFSIFSFLITKFLISQNWYRSYSKFKYTNRQSSLKDGWISSLGIPSWKKIIKHKIKICYFSCGSSFTSSSVNDFGPLNFYVVFTFYVCYIVSGFYFFTRKHR